MKIDLPTIILAIVVVLLIGGALLVYPFNPNEFKVGYSNDGTTVRIDMDSTLESDYYSVSVNLKNDTARELLVFYDEDYTYPISLVTLQKDIEQLCGQLKYLGVSYRQIDADELKTVLLDTAHAKERMVLNTSGAFPCNVYASDGTVMTTDLVSPWMNAGGVIIWYCEELAGHYSAPLDKDFKDWETNQPLENNPLGFQFIEEKTFATQRSEVSRVLSVTQNVCDEYSVKADSNIINLGYESEDGRYSIAFAEFGLGGMLVNGGDWSQDISIAKIVASAAFDWTGYTYIESETGRFTGKETIEYSATSGADAFYVCMGTLTPRAGGLFLL